MSDAREFLTALFTSKPDDAYILLWTMPDKVSHWFKNVDKAINFAESRRAKDVYVGVALSGQDLGPKRRCTSDKVTGIVGIWADLDCRSEAHPSKALPATLAEALEILPDGLPPTYIVNTGNGVHVWWLFRQPLVFESDGERNNAANLAAGFQKLLSQNAAARGWKFDCLKDLARVMRIPGTENCKKPLNPKKVSIHTRSEHRYDPSDLHEFLEQHSAPHVEEAKKKAAWPEDFGGGELSIDPNATVSDAVLASYKAKDQRFRLTWLRQRDDLNDQSQSGYDLALASFACKNGHSEQQAVDLIIHHRRIHRQRQRTRLDYFQRTIAKAYREQDARATPSGYPGAEAGKLQVTAKPNSPAERALLCEGLSTALGICVQRIVKIDGQEPTYRLELETGKIAFSSVDKLVGQPSFRMKIAGACEYMLPKFPQKRWEWLAQMMLHAVTVEEGGDEADLVGAAILFVDRYLSETPFADFEDLSFHGKLKPCIYQGRIAISAADFRRYLNSDGEIRHIKEITAMLSALGAVSERLKGTCRRDQTRWLLPTNHFAPDDWACDVTGRSHV